MRFEDKRTDEDDDASGWKKQFENSTGSSASAWALLAGSRVRHNETKRSEGSGGSVTGQIIRKLHAELADRDRALSYARSEVAEANRRADIEKRRADASRNTTGERRTNSQEQQSLALMKQELTSERSGHL